MRVLLSKITTMWSIVSLPEKAGLLLDNIKNVAVLEKVESSNYLIKVLP